MHSLWIFVVLAVLALPARADLRDRFGATVLADAPGSSGVSGVRITYLGTNAYLLESRDANLLIDPYFSRQSAFRLLLRLRAVQEMELVDGWVKTAPRLDAILVTHGHVDHLFDAPRIAEHTSARLLASPLGIRLAGSVGVPRRQLDAVTAGSVRHVRGATVRVLPAAHDRVLGRTPFPDPPPQVPPVNADDWTLGEPLAFLIEMGGRRIYLEAGSQPGKAIPAKLGRIDLAILGEATRDSINGLAERLAALRPRVFLPSHQDDFFQPLRRGFIFLPGSDYPRVRRLARAQGCEPILLDYFQPWTLR